MPGAIYPAMGAGLWMLVLGACRGCSACEPGIPTDPGDDDPRTDTEQPVDTHDTAPPEDTALPPPCAQPEVEPNDAITEANEIEREEWACGTFGSGSDYEWLVFPGDTASWFRVEVEAAAIGSAANVSLYLTDAEFSFYALVEDSAASEDPWVVFPSAGVDAYYLYLYEDDEGWGEDFEWELMASETKISLTWDLEEEETNDTPSEAMEFEAGNVVYGTIGEESDYDWYHFTTPETKWVVTWTVEAYGSGSPANTRLALYDSTIIDDPDNADPLERAFTDTSSYDSDPRLEYSGEGVADYYLLIKESDENAGPLYWYTLEYTLEEQ